MDQFDVQRMLADHLRGGPTIKKSFDSHDAQRMLATWLRNPFEKSNSLRFVY